MVESAAPESGQSGKAGFEIHDKPVTGQGLPKHEIVRGTKAFQSLFHGGERWNGKTVRILFTEGERRQVAFAVSKRLGKAVLRNRMKRLMREAYRRNRHTIGSIKMIMVARRASKDIHFQEIEKDLLLFIKTRQRHD